MSREINKTSHVIVNGSVAQQVTEILTRQLIEGKFKEGDFLPTEEELCHEFGIGRSSVREAIKTLESRGLVRKQQGKGVVVIDETIQATAEMLKITLDYKNISLKDMVDFRIAMEIKLAEMAAMNATDEDIASMRECLDLMKGGEEFSFKEFAQYDYQFHQSVANASRNSISILIMQTLRPILYDQISITVGPDFNPERAIQLHETIFNEIKNHHIKAAGQAMATHLNETHRIISELGSAS
ncbi:MAG: FadR/GntR family transcriptional regulator [Rikenellaceae bacterium]